MFLCLFFCCGFIHREAGFWFLFFSVVVQQLSTLTDSPLESNMIQNTSSAFTLNNYDEKKWYCFKEMLIKEVLVGSGVELM